MLCCYRRSAVVLVAARLRNAVRSTAAVVLRQSNRHRCGPSERVMRRRVAACRLLLSGDLGLSTQRCPTNRRCASTARMRTVTAVARTYSLRRAEHRGLKRSWTRLGSWSGFAAAKSFAAAAEGRSRDLGGRSEVSIYLIHPLAQHLPTLAPLQTAHSAHCWTTGARHQRER